MKYEIGEPIPLCSHLLFPVFLALRSDNIASHVFVVGRELNQLIDDTYSKLSIAVVVHDDLWTQNGL